MKHTLSLFLSTSQSCCVTCWVLSWCWDLRDRTEMVAVVLQKWINKRERWKRQADLMNHMNINWSSYPTVLHSALKRCLSFCIKAITMNLLFIFLLILAAHVDNRGLSITACCGKDIDRAIMCVFGSEWKRESINIIDSLYYIFVTTIYNSVAMSSLNVAFGQLTVCNPN